MSATGFRIDGKEAKKYFQDSWSQEDVLNKLTNNGVNKGIYMLNGELYMNATYVRTGQLSADRVYGGTLTLGGRNNANGKLSIRDASNTEIGRWDNSGIYINGGEIYSRTDKSEASIRGGNIHVSHSGTNIGHIGTREFNEAPESKGIMFGIESTAYYLTWAARSRSTETTYPVKMLYANKTFSDYEAGKLYVSCNTDFKGYEIQNAYINGLRVRKSFSIPNNIACDIYSDMDFHSWTLKNITVSNLSAVNGYTTVNGSLRVVTDVDITSNGGVTCEYATIRARDGIITILE